jgi:hypothetical protein
MMSAKLILTLTIAAMLLVAVFLLPATVRGQPTDFIISNADAVSYMTTTVSSQLNGLIANVAPRFVVQYANGLRYYSIPPISSTLTSLMAQVADRFVIQYANANRFYGFTYPLQMIGDTTPPQISTSPVLIAFGNGSVTLQWITNEFATTVLKYGVQLGNYTDTLTDTLYFKLHEFTLTGLTPGARYYYQIAHTDRSGNVFQSVEYNFVAKFLVYLPLVRK